MRLISRRIFLALTGGVLAAPRFSWATNEVPALLDHILLGCNDLDPGIAFVEERSGVRAAFGGVHPGRGTQNALLSLGERRYLEIIAPDPAQADTPDTYGLRRLVEPRLVHWAAHPDDLEAFAQRLRAAGVAFKGPTPGSRKRPDGRVLNWKTLNLAEDYGGLLPFFIEWSADSIHPSADSPKGCSLVRFEAAVSDSDTLAEQTALLGLDLPIVKADKPQLRAAIAGPKGHFSVTS
ncbi:MAG TPA: VOC family protein [Candidatus Acidoferrum sp.]|nr:VOC family protein [Candidatus Acidoferrum sp.]